VASHWQVSRERTRYNWPSAQLRKTNQALLLPSRKASFLAVHDSYRHPQGHSLPCHRTQPLLARVFSSPPLGSGARTRPVRLTAAQTQTAHGRDRQTDRTDWRGPALRKPFARLWGIRLGVRDSAFANLRATILSIQSSRPPGPIDYCRFSSVRCFLPSLWQTADWKAQSSGTTASFPPTVHRRPRMPGRGVGAARPATDVLPLTPAPVPVVPAPAPAVASHWSSRSPAPARTRSPFHHVPIPIQPSLGTGSLCAESSPAFTLTGTSRPTPSLFTFAHSADGHISYAHVQQHGSRKISSRSFIVGPPTISSANSELEASVRAPQLEPFKSKGHPHHHFHGKLPPRSDRRCTFILTFVYPAPFRSRLPSSRRSSKDLATLTPTPIDRVYQSPPLKLNPRQQRRGRAHQETAPFALPFPPLPNHRREAVSAALAASPFPRIHTQLKFVTRYSRPP
jgi:hypothetical protein